MNFNGIIMNYGLMNCSLLLHLLIQLNKQMELYNIYIGILIEKIGKNRARSGLRQHLQCCDK